MSINRNASMRPETNPAGNLLQEISEAELNQLSAGAGEPRASWGDFCTSTLECTFGTMICCPPETKLRIAAIIIGLSKTVVIPHYEG